MLQNGNTYFYDRANSKLTTETFADCAEIAMRHLCNLLFFDADKRAFNVPDVKNDNLQAFYTKQSPLLANAGDINTRSLWNSVVGDLNTKDDTDPIAYNQTNNEVDTGFGNMIKVLAKVLNVTFDTMPTDTLGNKTKWLQASLEKLLKTMNPSYIYAVNLKGLKNYNKDIAGDASIKVSKKEVDTEEVKDGDTVVTPETFKVENLFSFTIMQSDIHANINSLKNHALETKTEEINKALSNGASSSSRAPWRNPSCS